MQAATIATAATAAPATVAATAAPATVATTAAAPATVGYKRGTLGVNTSPYLHYCHLMLICVFFVYSSCCILNTHLTTCVMRRTL